MRIDGARPSRVDPRIAWTFCDSLLTESAPVVKNADDSDRYADCASAYRTVGRSASGGMLAVSPLRPLSVGPAAPVRPPD